MMDSSSVWNGQDPTLSVSSQDDFQQFLDMNLGEFDFQDFNPQQPQTTQLVQREDEEAMDTAMDNGRILAGQDTTMQEHMPATTASSHPAMHAAALAHAHSSNESVPDFDAQIQYLQNQKYQHQQRQMQQHRSYYAQNPRMMPPTPNSVELHGNHTTFYPQSDPQQQAMYERFQMQGKEHEIAFTPLGTPAVTPLEVRFSIPEYTVPGAYLSPLSSPALNAQNGHAAIYDQRHSGATNSPIDTNLASHSAPASTTILPRKASKKPQKPRNARGVRQSPIVKPRKGKKGSSATISEQVLGDIIEPSHCNGTISKATSSSHSTASAEDSENGSISPEHLSDMAPPPIPPPGSAGRSPYIQSQNSGTRTQQLQVLGSPATPASLMRISGSPRVNLQAKNQYMDIDDPEVDGFLLPEAAAAANSRPQLSRIETQSDGQVTPTLSSTGPKTPGFQPLPSPTFNRPRSAVSASQSPQIDAMNGSAGKNGTGRKTSTAARSSKKRSSSSVLASPALLPRISPSIKPLLPGGTVAEDTASLLLASKSNYQNILEGTHLPGVSYPTELSTNLTSKRTSHKIAEQGRRNRINSALQEIATLLPRGQTKDSGGEKSGSGDAGDHNDAANGKGNSQSANSKASTVEQAIEYIKQLKKDLADANKRAEEAEKLLNGKT